MIIKKRFFFQLYLSWRFLVVPIKDVDVDDEQEVKDKFVSMKKAEKMRKPITLKSNTKISSSDVKGEKLDVIFIYLRISEGRNFCLTERKKNNLFATCRLFSPTEILTSEVCWETTRPIFSLSHTLPVSLNKEFFVQTEKNHLYVEIWDYFSENKKDLVGIASISLQQFYLAFYVSFNLFIQFFRWY